MIILLIIITSTANATNNNQTQLEDIQPQEYTNNHNNEQININQPTQYQKQTNNNTQDNNKEKSIKKDQTQEKTKTATKTTLTLGNTKNIYVNDKVCIYGKLTANGKNIANAKITIKIHTSSYTLTTTKYGNYNTNITINTNGKKTITAIYTGNNNYTTATNQTYVNVNKKTTLLTLGSTKKVNVGNKVNIYGKLTANSKNLANAKVTIQVDGQTYTLTTTKYGNYNTNITMNSAGTKTITATYAGTNAYTTSTNKTTVTVNKKTTLLTLGSTKNVYVGDKVCIYGKLTANSKNLANAKVTIQLDGQTYTLTTTKYGNYNTNITLTSAGTKIITATYSATNIYTGTTNKTYVTANKKSTLVTIGSTKNINVDDKICVYGKLTANGKNLAYKKISIYVDGNSYTVTTTKYGNYNTNITISTKGDKLITAIYDGDNYYYADSSTTTCNVKGRPIQIYVDTDGMGKYSTYAEIWGYCRDNTYEWYNETNNYIKNVKLTLTLGNVKYLTYTNEYGEFYFSIKINQPELNKFTIDCEGDSTHESCSTTRTFYVYGNDIYITISNTTKTPDKKYIKIEGKLFDQEGIMVKNAPLTLQIDGVTYYTKTNEFGSYTLFFKNNNLHRHILSVIFEGSSKYGKKEELITFIPQEKAGQFEINTPLTSDDWEMYNENADIKRIGTTAFLGWHQLSDGNNKRGVYVDATPVGDNSRGHAIKVTGVTFYYKNNYNGNIITLSGTQLYKDSYGYYSEIINGYTPYKAIAKYKILTSQEIRDIYLDYNNYQNDYIYEGGS